MSRPLPARLYINWTDLLQTGFQVVIKMRFNVHPFPLYYQLNAAADGTVRESFTIGILPNCWMIHPPVQCKSKSSLISPTLSFFIERVRAALCWVAYSNPPERGGTVQPKLLFNASRRSESASDIYIIRCGGCTLILLFYLLLLFAYENFLSFFLHNS